MPDLSVVIVTDIIRLEIESEVCARLPFERAAQIDVFLAAIWMRHIRCRIEIKLINLVIAASNAETQSIADRAGNVSFDRIALLFEFVGPAQ